MSETPRKRLERLLEGLVLPKGFRLTPARERTLRGLGKQMLKGEKLELYGSRVNFRALKRRWYLNDDWRSKEKAAFRAMGKAGWVHAKQPVVPGSWSTNTLACQPGIEGLAKRLAARQVLWEQRKAQSTEGLEEVNRELAGKLWKARQAISNASLVPTLSEHDMLTAYKQVKALMEEGQEVQRELEAAKAMVDQVPEPTEEEALTWLMMRELSKEQGK